MPEQSSGKLALSQRAAFGCAKCLCTKRKRHPSRCLFSSVLFGIVGHFRPQHPQKGGSESEPSRGRLQPSRRAERALLRKRRSKGAGGWLLFCRRQKRSRSKADFAPTCGRHLARPNAFAPKEKGTFRCPFLLVRATGLEPARITPPEPKSGASANSAIPAWEVCRHICGS